MQRKKTKLRKIKRGTLLEGTNVFSLFCSETKSGVHTLSLRDSYQPGLNFQGSGFAALLVVTSITVYYP